jgi:hypothetical protein
MNGRKTARIIIKSPTFFLAIVTSLFIILDCGDKASIMKIDFERYIFYKIYSMLTKEVGFDNHWVHNFIKENYELFTNFAI